MYWYVESHASLEPPLKELVLLCLLLCLLGFRCFVDFRFGALGPLESITKIIEKFARN